MINLKVLKKDDLSTKETIKNYTIIIEKCKELKDLADFIGTKNIIKRLEKNAKEMLKAGKKLNIHNEKLLKKAGK